LSSYDAIAELYDPWSVSVVEDVAFYLEEARRSGGPVVELGVGTGRIAVPIAADGIRVIGVDSSRGMLDVCARRAALAGVEIDLRVGDLREPPVDELVPLVICPFRSLLHMHTDEDRLAVFAAAHRLLLRDGRFVFDVFAPDGADVEGVAVAEAAMQTGVARRQIEDMQAYRETLRARLSPATSVLTLAHANARANPKRVVFAEAEEEVVLRAAIAFRDGGYGTPVLVGRDEVPDKLRALGIEDPESFELHNSRHSPLVPQMVDYLYARLQRRGYLRREVEAMVNQDRNIFGALLLALGQADAMITGVTRTYGKTLRQVRRVIDPIEGRRPCGIHVVVGKKHTVFMADTMVTERPEPKELVAIAEHTAAVARRMGHEPRVAFLSYSTFGNPSGEWIDNVRDAVALLEKKNPGFEFEGEMAPDVALNPNMRQKYPFSRLSGPANVLIMPGLQSANISAKLLREVDGDAVIGPMLVGMEKPVQIATMSATASELLTLAVLAGAGIAH